MIYSEFIALLLLAQQYSSHTSHLICPFPLYISEGDFLDLSEVGFLEYVRVINKPGLLSRKARLGSKPIFSRMEQLYVTAHNVCSIIRPTMFISRPSFY